MFLMKYCLCYLNSVKNLYTISVESCSDQENCDIGPGDLLEANDSWEENWLFKRHQLAGSSRTNLVLGSESVSMLIPNPESPISATIGDK